MAESKIENLLITKEYDCPAFTISRSGYNTYTSVDATLYGYKPISCRLTDYQHPSTYLPIPVVMYDTDNGKYILYFMLFGVDNVGSYPAGKVKAEITYRKI